MRTPPEGLQDRDSHLRPIRAEQGSNDLKRRPPAIRGPAELSLLMRHESSLNDWGHATRCGQLQGPWDWVAGPSPAVRWTSRDSGRSAASNSGCSSPRQWGRPPTRLGLAVADGGSVSTRRGGACGLGGGVLRSFVPGHQGRSVARTPRTSKKASLRLGASVRLPMALKWCRSK